MIYPAVKAVATAPAGHVHAGVQAVVVRNAQLIVTMNIPVGPPAAEGTATFLANASSVAATFGERAIVESVIINGIVRHVAPRPQLGRKAEKIQLQCCTVAFGNNKTNSN